MARPIKRKSSGPHPSSTQLYPDQAAPPTKKQGKQIDGAVSDTYAKPFLCAIYLEDVVSLLPRSTVEECRLLSSHYNTALVRRRATGGLPRVQNSFFQIRTVPLLGSEIESHKGVGLYR